MHTHLRLRELAAAGLAATVVAAALAVSPPPAQAALAPIANPPIDESCGVDVTLVLDASGSINSSHAVDDVRDAGGAFLEALKNTNSRARVTQFAAFSEELAPTTLVDDASLDVDGALGEAIADYYNPIPPRPDGASIYRYDGRGDHQDPNNYDKRNDSNQYTNWDQALDQAGTPDVATPSEIVVFVTDGDATGFDFNQPGDPFDAGPPPDVSVKTDSDDAEEPTLDRAVEEANEIKATTRMLAVGVGDALQNPESEDRLVAISGPQVVRDADLPSVDSINDVDVALVEDFEDLAQFLRSVVLELCSPSLTVRKLAQTPESADYQPAEGWGINVTPEVPTSTENPPFSWVLPPDATGATWSLSTDDDGFAQFQWEPDPPEADSRAQVTETLEPGYTAGRPTSSDYRCELRDEFGNVRVEEGEFSATGGGPGFVLDPIGQEIVTCTLYNSYNYAPAIDVTKVNDPTEVRGDLRRPATEVTSRYVVTNPGNTVLDAVSITDDRCSPVREVAPGGVNVGDTNGNGLLEPLPDPLDPSSGEQWQFDCTRGIRTGPSTDPAGQNIVNAAVAQGTDPTGQTVTDTATDDVDAFNPAIELEKLVDNPANTDPPAKEEVVAPDTPVDYSYRVSNTGNTPLGTVTLTDDTPPCTSPTRGPDDPGNDDGVLDVGETWTYDCSATITESALNVATVEATPLNPLDGNNPFGPVNPPVVDDDFANVTVAEESMTLLKTADPAVVLLDPGTSPGPEPVTYTYRVTNTGQDPLTRPATNPGSAKDPGWLGDNTCTPVTYVSGDVNGNDLIDPAVPGPGTPAETWIFTCSGDVSIPTENLATLTADPVIGGVVDPGLRITARAFAYVDVEAPGIEVTKRAERGVVLDPDAVTSGDAVSGPDVPSPRPAVYTYDVANTGTVPLSLDANPPTDDTCAPLTFVSGDTIGNGLLDPGEVWEYECTTPLSKDDANTPPNPGDISGLVTNTVSTTGVPVFGGGMQPGKSVSGSDSAQVLVNAPSLSLTKTASADVVNPGDVVRYTVEVTNTGDVGLRPVGPTDDKCAPLTYQSGDTNDNGLVDGANSAAAETWTYECSRTIQQPTPPETIDTNTATVRGIGPLGNSYEAQDSADVRVVEHAINLTKTVGKALVPVGTEVPYFFDVTNAGTSPIPADDVLADVFLGDVATPGQRTCLTPQFVGGDDNGDDLLDRVPAEVWRYECTAPIEAPTHNLAVVEAVGGTQLGLPARVIDWDVAFVQTFDPGIEVAKTAEPVVLPPGGGEVTYTYEITNTGDVPLAGVAERIADDTCGPLAYVEGDTDGDGLLDTPTSIFEDDGDEVWVFTCTSTLAVATTNVVTVQGSPTDAGGSPLCGLGRSDPNRIAEPCDVTDSDEETVELLPPGSIAISKVTEPGSSVQFDFDMDGETFQLADGESEVFEGLDPGSYSVSEVVPSGWTLTDLTCQDPSGDTVTDAASATATIDLGPGESVVCTFANSQNPTVVPQTGRNLQQGLAWAVLLLGAGGMLHLLGSTRRTR